ncbi:hypothetical protein [Modicisalibacter radicis]|uniref:hypothetical protein n=1 Tax=Halomonas sp. EAR18 TaxID=2518972 RepID=UPI00109D6724|nr:hypothetical protein [Halomonas sp. EAR18]
MLKTRFTAVLLAALLAGGTISLAQAAPGPAYGHGPQGPHSRVEALFDSWQLDEASRQAFADEQRDYREQRHALREAHEQRLGEILDERQLAALHVMRVPPHRMQDHGRHDGPGTDHQRPPMRHGDPGELFSALFKSWGLSDAEQSQLADTREQFFSQARELRDRQLDDREARHEAWQALREEHKQALGEVLSDDQLAVLEALRPSGPRHRGPDA